MPGVEIVRRRALPSHVRRILDALPDWFGIESANDAYVEDSRTFPTYVAVAGDEVVGVLDAQASQPRTVPRSICSR